MSDKTFYKVSFLVAKDEEENEEEFEEWIEAEIFNDGREMSHNSMEFAILENRIKEIDIEQWNTRAEQKQENNKDYARGYDKGFAVAKHQAGEK